MKVKLTRERSFGFTTYKSEDGLVKLSKEEDYSGGKSYYWWTLTVNTPEKGQQVCCMTFDKFNDAKKFLKALKGTERSLYTNRDSGNWVEGREFISIGGQDIQSSEYI